MSSDQYPVPNRVPYTIHYKQQQEIGSTYEQSYQLPEGKKFIIEYLNVTCQNPYKDRYMKLVLTTGPGTACGIGYNFIFDPMQQNNFPYGIYKINQLVRIAAEGKVDINIAVVNPEVPDDGIGDLVITLSGYLTDSY